MDTYVKAYNETKQCVLAERVLVANTPVRRIVGLLGSQSLEAGEGLMIVPCNSIHSFFMKFAFDALFLDNTGKVVKLAREIKPFRLLPPVIKAQKVIELPAGTAVRTNTAIGDRIVLI